MNDSQSFQEVILQGTTRDSDFLRFCLSDALPVKIGDVLEEVFSPTDYAHQVMKTHSKNVRQFFIEDSFFKRLPPRLSESFLFDRLVHAALLISSIVVRPQSKIYVDQLLSQACLFLLVTNHRNMKATQCSGLSHYSLYANAFIEHNSKFFIKKETELLHPFFKSVSSFDKEDWILYDKKWRDSLLYSEKRLQAFRNFIHIAMKCFVISEENLEEVLNMKHEDLFILMYDFVELRNTPKVKVSEIKIFISRLIMYFDIFPTNMFFSLLIEGPFEAFKMYCSNFSPPPLSITENIAVV